MSNEKKQAYKFKHTKRDGEPNFLNYSYEIALLKSHEERIKYMSDIDEKYHDSVYLTCMQMGLAKTISNLPTREERKKAWQELPEHNITFKNMKDMVYHRILNIFKEKQ